jgi:hypothetical protein
MALAIVYMRASALLVEGRSSPVRSRVVQGGVASTGITVSLTVHLKITRCMPSAGHSQGQLRDLHQGCY